jgi:putative PIN family toxin of toxin-antitoxin system
VLKVVIDTNISIRALLGGPATLPILTAWQGGKFQVVISESLLNELDQVWQRPRLRARIDTEQANTLLEQLRWRGIMVELTSVPPRCRDPKDHPVLATAIDGQVEAIVTGDADLRTDEQLRVEMVAYGVQLWGIETLLERVRE